MKNRIIVFALILFVSVFTACGNNEAGKGEEAKLSDEFTLEQKKLEGVARAETILFAGEVTKAKVSALGADKKGASLSYALDQEETEKLINLFQKDGYMVGFVDSMDKFYTGVSRLTCFTTTNDNFLAIIDDNGNTNLYRVELTDDIINFLNDASEKNYKSSKGRTGWFDKVFNSK